MNQAIPTTESARRPNVVFIVGDNIGFGDPGAYGGQIPTPNLDAMARGGIRLTNYTVEPQCTPSRSAFMTGRLPVRSGTASVNQPGRPYGLSNWEYTLGNLFSDAGYDTAMFGKWHLGEHEGRLPTDQGFDKWWGIKNTSDESMYTSHPLFAASGQEAPHVWHGVKGEASTPDREFNLALRPRMDELIADKAVGFINEHAGHEDPFFLYVAFTTIHNPLIPHPDFVSSSGGGVRSDLLAELDHRIGQIRDSLQASGIAEDTVLVFTSDNAATQIGMDSGGSNGPWRGNFLTPPFEGSCRVPAIVEWKGMLPEGLQTNEMVAAVDWLPTLAAFTGNQELVPDDRPLDGVDTSQHLLGNAETSGRDAVALFGPDNELMSVKWRSMKVIFRYSEGMSKPIVTPQFPMIFDLMNDPGEQCNLYEFAVDGAWVFGPVYDYLGQLDHSFAAFPNIQPGEEFSGYAARGSSDHAG